MSDEEKAKKAAPAAVERTYEERLKACTVIARPMATKKQAKKLYKLVKKSAGAKSVRRGVKEVVKGLRKGVKGVCVIAGDISPIDVITHLPVYCEENEVRYMYVPSKQDLGAAASTKRPTSCVLITPKPGFDSQDLYTEVEAMCAEEESQVPRL
ncbi:RNA-binding protein Nhp2 [Tribonema minus]|uniref:H/ACA ribonucleoprotein complex subunit 2 n=1 Tax=Tribonema minus TaxID=303371 RepID=A0A836CPU2_9STRA|nr:RNA-binding protein Nhp2 [Tribonema minus]